MQPWLKRALIAVPTAIVLSVVVYGGKGWYDARSDAPALRERVSALKGQGLGAESLDVQKRSILITVEDPSFDTNNGTDFSSAGAGATTLTQSLSKRLAFKRFTPGIRKVRQTFYALGLGQTLSKDEVLTLFLAEASFKGHDGRWTKGFDAASRRFFGVPLKELKDDQFMLLVATGIAPSDLNVDAPSPKLISRVQRIGRLVEGKCKPSSHNDVWLDGCA
jgi:monofunctional glycosyltransferase